MRSLIRLFHISVLLLFLELMLIRWVSTEVNILAYLQNSILVVCFLGIGFGCLAHSKRTDISEMLIPVFILLALLCIPFTGELFRKASYLLIGLDDFLMWERINYTTHWQKYMNMIIGTVVVFVVLWLVFRAMYPLGKLLGKEFAKAQSPIAAYSANIFGSLIGVWGFTALSFLSLAPYIWFIFLCLLSFPFIYESTQRTRNIALLVFIVVLPLTSSSYGFSSKTWWSPYQKLELIPLPGDEYRITVNNAGYQQIENNSEAYKLTNPDLFPKELVGLSQYDIPSRFQKNSENVLVVGAGSGNDIAGVLKNTKAKVVAVEIDPVIHWLGTIYHPEKPYSSPLVEVEINDARSYFNQSKRHFDLIVFGLLDSHTTPVMTNARLDNFVYTVESLRSAFKLLEPHGILVLIFQPTAAFIIDRLSNTLEKAVGQKPLVFTIPKTEIGWGGTAFVVGDTEKIREAIDSQPDLAKFIDSNSAFPSSFITGEAIPTTDDWPYLYVPKPMIPKLFFFLAFVLFLITLTAWKASSLDVELRNMDLNESIHFASLGAAFSLLETFGICQASLLFGSTWIVNTTVISGVLIMILLANFVSFLKFKALDIASRILLPVSVLMLLFADFGNLSNLNILQKLFWTGLILTIPMFFSGIIFADSFQRTKSPTSALCANLLGALVGGILQLLSFRVGIPNLLLIVAAFYVIAVIAKGSRETGSYVSNT